LPVELHRHGRHRVGTAFSQTSGRYVRGDSVDIVFDPILEPVRDLAEDILARIEAGYADMVGQIGLDDMTDFDRKKKITSALRRFLPNGQSNEIGFSLNLRTLRHTVMMRTSRHAEWEIRDVFARVYRLVKEKHPLILSDARERDVNGQVEVYGMRMNPYDAPWPSEPT
jgi:thymidylate synthase (FAD)